MEVKVGSLWRVIVTEYDEGVQRVDPEDTKFFTERSEAVAYAEKMTDYSSRSIYWVGHVSKV